MAGDSLSSFIFTHSQSSGCSAGSNRRFEFHKRGQLLIGVNNKTLAVVAMRVCNPDRSSVGIHA